jgi:hypothetical protein
LPTCSPAFFFDGTCASAYPSIIEQFPPRPAQRHGFHPATPPPTIPFRRTISPGFLEGSSGVKIRYAVFRSKEREAKGTVVLLQGRSECIEKYFETINDLTARGLWVATFDWRGQAGSDRLIPRTAAPAT